MEKRATVARKKFAPVTKIIPSDYSVVFTDISLIISGKSLAFANRKFGF
ncbi:MAG: hypothetical protein J5651_02595 [Salinivirgaceae bacterium]|nr:hypothetical protein [Salinivirgaceae bacterium]